MCGVVGVLVDEALLQKYGNLWPIDALLRLTQRNRKCLTKTHRVDNALKFAQQCWITLRENKYKIV